MKRTAMRYSMLPLLLLFCSSVLGQRAMTLEECVKRAEEKNLTVINAMLDVEMAEADHEQSQWALLPDLNGFASHGYNFGRVVDRFTNTFATDRVRTNNFYLNSNLGIYEGGRKVNRIKQALLDEQSAEQLVESALNQVRVEVVQAFLDVLGLRERIKANEAQVANTRVQLERTDALVDAGRLARAESLTLRSQLAQEEFTLTEVNSQHDQRLLALGRAMQMEMSELFSLDIIAPVITGLQVVEPTAAPEEVVENVLRNNPTYARSELNMQSAEKAIAIARAGSIPSLGLNASIGTGYSGLNQQVVGEPIVGDPTPIGYTESGEIVYTPSVDYNTELTPFGTQLDQNLNESVGLTLSVPLFNNMRNRTNVAQARIQHERSRNVMMNVRNDLQQEVLDAMVMQRNAYRQFLAAERAVEAGELAQQYAEERFEAGTITSIELATATTQQNRNTAEWINAKYVYLKASKYLDILQGIPVSL